MLTLRPMMCTLLAIGLLSAAPSAAPQSTTTTAIASVSLPRYVSFTGELKNQDGKPAAGTVDVTFLLFEQESGGEPLWTENQRVTVDAAGHYTVTLGANTNNGLPTEFFATKKARWLEIEPDGLPVPDRVLLLSVPYAFKAGDAETLGGLPASAFLRAASSGGTVSGPSPAAGGVTSNVLGGAGVKNYVPLWTPDGNTLGNSGFYQVGTGTAARIGLNTTTPQATLDIAGSLNLQGLLRLPFINPATSTSGAPSQALIFQASTFSSTTQAPVTEKFQLTAVPKGNNTASPSASLALFYGTGTPTATGLSIASNGQITFAQGQTFPGTGTGTITGVTGANGLTGGGTSGAVTLKLDKTYTDGRYAQLAANNTYTGTQIVNNSVGIGITPSFPLHVNGWMRSETGLSLGGNAPLSVDAPSLAGGHFLVDGAGHVGINQPFPTAALDVGGSINASGSVTAQSASFAGPVTFAANQTFPGTISQTTADARYPQLAGNNVYSGVQIMNNNVGIGITPTVPLHVQGVIRSETGGLSLGGTAPLVVDAPFVGGGHFVVDGQGHVGVNNPNPQQALDVVGNVNASGVSIGGDQLMTSAPHMYMTGYVPAPINAGVVEKPVFTIPSKNIVITRFTVGGWNPCFSGGQQVFNLATGDVNFPTWLETLVVSADPNSPFSDTGSVSHPIPAGQKVWVVSGPTPTCGQFMGPVGDIAVSVEYVMQ